MQKARAARSPGKRIHYDEVKQERLDEGTVKAVTKAGGTNFIQSEYIKEVAKVAIKSESATLTAVKPHVKVHSTKAWNQALLLAVAFLKRYKMNQTIETLRTEYPETPKSTGYSRASEVEGSFNDLLALADDLKNVKFRERVEIFEQDIEDQIHEFEARSPSRFSPKKSPKRSPNKSPVRK